MKRRKPTLAICEGHNSYSTKRTSRVGTRQATAMADGARTYTEAHVNKDGSGFVQVLRPGLVNVRLVFGARKGRYPAKVTVQLGAEHKHKDHAATIATLFNALRNK